MYKTPGSGTVPGLFESALSSPSTAYNFMHPGTIVELSLVLTLLLVWPNGMSLDPLMAPLLTFTST